MSDPIDLRPAPCISCPYRRDVPSGVWDASEYDKLCLEQSQRILTADLRWVPVGEIRVGDMVTAFGAGGTIAHHRRLVNTPVTRSVAARADCVRVRLSDGSDVLCTVDHPWLTRNVGGRYRFIEAAQLLDGLVESRGDRRYVARVFPTWETDTSWEAGWLSGMYDGEGSLSWGKRGGYRLSLHQNPGPVFDRAERLLAARGYSVYWNTSRKLTLSLELSNRVDVLRALGTIRPMRLLSKWQADLPFRLMGSVWVESVEYVGSRDIQVVSTAEGTYFGEGFAMHNCNYDGDTAYQSPALFECHQRDNTVCAGWLAHRDPYDLLAVRIGVSIGVLPVDVFEYRTRVPLFATGAEAAEHGKREIDDPGLAARRLVDKIVSRA